MTIRWRRSAWIPPSSLWNDAKAHPAPEPFRGGFARFGSPDWSAALELMIATHGAEPYKQRVEELFPTMIQHMGFGGWQAVRALPYLDADYKTRFKAALASLYAAVEPQTCRHTIRSTTRVEAVGAAQSR